MAGQHSSYLLQFITDGGSESDGTKSTEDSSASAQGWGWDDSGVLWLDDSVSDAELLQGIIALSSTDTTPSREDVREHTLFHPAVYVQRFGSWTAALEEADVFSGRVDGLLDEEIMDELASIAETVGRSPTPTDLEQVDGVSVESVLRRFGRWNNALAEAHVECVTTNDLTEDEQFLLYKKEDGGYESGHGDHGFFRGWDEHHAVLDFLVEQGEERFTVSEFASGTGISEERAIDMLEFVDSRGRIRRDGEGWVVRVDEQEEVAGWLHRGTGLQ